MPSLSIVNLHVSSNKKNIEFCATMLLWRIYVADKNKTYFGLTVNCPILDFLDRFHKSLSSIKFHINPFSGSRVVTCGQTDMTKLTVAFRNFVNAPENLLMLFTETSGIYVRIT